MLGEGHTLEEKQSEESRKLAHLFSLLELDRHVFILPDTGLHGPLKEFSMGDLVD